MNIDRHDLRGPSAGPLPSSIADGAHPRIRLSHPAGLARRNRVRTDLETMAVDVEVELGSVYEADGPDAAREVLSEYIAGVFGGNGWSLLDYSPLMDRDDGRDCFGVKVNVVESDGLAPEGCGPIYFVVRSDGEGARVSGQFKGEQSATAFARKYVTDHPHTSVSVVRFSPSETVASFGVDSEAPATLYARCILSREK